MAGVPLATMTLDPATWDLTLDAGNNISLTAPPGSLAQDAASAVKTFQGECFFDTTVGVPWLQQIFGRPLNLPLLKAQLADAAETVPGVASAQVFISSFAGRAVSGQVQVAQQSTGQTSVSDFSVTDPQTGAQAGAP